MTPHRRAGARLLALAACASGLLVASAGLARQAGSQDAAADARAAELVGRMTREEKLRLVFGFFGSPHKASGTPAHPDARPGSAGYVPGVPRLGIPPLHETDAGLGVATQRDSVAPYRLRTSLPSGLATAASFDPAVAYAGGRMIGGEARDSGFNVVLAGAVNLVREPRNGRNFEYAGEDPWLAGVMVGEHIRGVQSNGIISTIKHFALNAQETGRFELSADIDDGQARMSDLLAFELAIEQSYPGSVMCAYNRVNSVYACESEYLLRDVLKRDWGYKGFVMSDWGAVHSTVRAANAGLDQQSAYVFDKQPFFGESLRRAVESGEVAPARLDDMARRIVRAMAANGLLDRPVVERPIDFAANARVAQAAAEASIVLLKNEGGLLPLRPGLRRIAVIGGHADKGVIAGGGSSTVFPHGGYWQDPDGPRGWPGPIVYHPSPPLDAIRALAGDAEVVFHDGRDRAAAARIAAASDVALVFGTQWTAESVDAPLSLDRDGDALIAAVAAANPRTVAILQTGGPVLMPWAERVPAVVEAWYPGARGGTAIARVLFGEVDASGRLPVTFPMSLGQLPHPALPGADAKRGDTFRVAYREGAAVGYKWFERTDAEPLFPFGHGLSYTRFAHDALAAEWRDGALAVRFRVRNTGKRAGKDVAQVYLSPVSAAAGWETPRRLGGFRKVDLAPDAQEAVSLQIDPRLLAVFHTDTRTWRIAPGEYDVRLGTSARELGPSVRVVLPATTLPVGYDGSTAAEEARR